MSREFQITTKEVELNVPGGTAKYRFGLAKLVLHGEGSHAPTVSIEMQQTFFGHLVFVYACQWKDEEELGSFSQVFHTVEEGWRCFQELRDLLGLKGV